jgi:hypothetical protein
MEPQTWTRRELEDELDRFQGELEAAGLRPTSVQTYVERSRIFVRWLAGEYVPRASVNKGPAS